MIAISQMTARDNPRNATRSRRLAMGFVLGAVGSVVLGTLLIGVVSAVAGFRVQLHGLGWLYVPLLFGLGGAYALRFTDARRRRRHPDVRATRRPARASTGVFVGHEARLDPGFAAAMREAHAADLAKIPDTARAARKRRTTAA